MQIPQKDYVEQEQIGLLKEISSTIAEKNLALVLDNVTKNLYSDPIGAFVRELTSNGVDANKRNSNSEKVKVRIYKEGETVYFEVKDEGKGMTPEVFESVYMSWFESDKRNDNGQIGGWGIGSKSPLAYTESYELSTIADGMRYDYEIVRQSPSPTATLLASHPTNKKPGTTVRVEIHPDDVYKLHIATKRQLVYFDNVIVTNEIYYYNNHFKIIDHPLFVVRSDEQYPFDKDMHIVIGQVAYPIDWHILGKETSTGKKIPISPIKVPVGIKFEIGEIPVNLNRETIHYVDDNVKLKILQKISEVKEILKGLYVERLNLTSLGAYVRAYNSPKTSINLAGYEVYFGLPVSNSVFKLNSKGYSFEFDPSNLPMNAFEIINLSKKDGNNIVYDSFTKVFNNEFQRYVYSKKGELSHWNSLFRKDNYLVRRVPLTKAIVHRYAVALNLTYDTVAFGRFRTRLKLGAIKQVLAFISLLREEFSTDMSNYDIVPTAFIEAEKEKQRVLAEERKGNITYYDENNTKTTETLKTLIEEYQYVFYINRDAPYEERLAYMSLYKSFSSKYNCKKTIHNTSLSKTIYPRILIACFSPTTIKKIRGKHKELTLSKPIINNGKKEIISSTRTVDAFLPVEKIFKYTELYKQFHILRYTTLLNANGYNKYSLSNVSKYYNNIAKQIPLTPMYATINKETDQTFYPYFYFQSVIDSITKNRNPIHEDSLNTLLKVAVPFYIIGTTIKSSSNALDSKAILKTTIKNFKLTKLNSNYYGN